MAGTNKSVAKLPAFPGPGAVRQPTQGQPGARQMTGVPVTSVQPPTKAGGKESTRVSGSK